MKPEFLSAVVDTLLPGGSDTSPLPSGTAAGVTEKLAQRLVGAAREVILEAIASAAGGEDAFLRLSSDDRATTLGRVEAEMRGSFQAFVTLLLQDYYEAEIVLLAMGWRAEPPQPRGHLLPEFDEALLAPVKRRGRMWRDAP
jgi:hypothetical protein